MMRAANRRSARIALGIFAVLVVGALGACAAARVVRDISYPMFVEVEYPDGSQERQQFICEREVDSEGRTVPEGKLICRDLSPFLDQWLETITGKKQPGETNL